jgi:hypothetical protein
MPYDKGSIVWNIAKKVKELDRERKKRSRGLTKLDRHNKAPRVHYVMHETMRHS